MTKSINNLGAPVTIVGSHKNPPRHSTPAGKVNGNTRVRISLSISRKAGADAKLEKLFAVQAEQKKLNNHLSITDAQWSDNFGADPAAVAKVHTFCGNRPYKVEKVDIASCEVIISGRVSDAKKDFGAQLEFATKHGKKHISRTGSLQLPAELVGAVHGVHNLDQMPQAHAHFQIRRELDPSTTGIKPAAPAARFAGYTALDLAKFYKTAGGHGKGQKYGIIELGGGFRLADVTTYCKKLNIPVPKLTAVSVDGAKNSPSTAQGADGEVMLDIEVALNAYEAEFRVYFAPNTTAGFAHAIAQAIADGCSVISISWGSPESNWTPQDIQLMGVQLDRGAATGVTIIAAMGDTGSQDSGQNGKNNLDFPGSHPKTLAYGGTHRDPTTGEETVWNDDPTSSATGGGVSDVFDLPDYQKGVGVPKSANPGGRVGRGGPDFAGPASPSTGIFCRVDGQEFVIGGTSDCPWTAAEIIIINANLGKNVGWVHPWLYANNAADGLCTDVTVGDNDAYSAGKGYDCCTGLGTPVFSAWQASLSKKSTGKVNDLLAAAA